MSILIHNTCKLEFGSRSICNALPLLKEATIDILPFEKYSINILPKYFY